MALRLKSLELHGYKTFASRTVFEFSGSIAAIVGPNGSGKSNVADSLRWVLGEQSYSLLRGRKTEDMIFAGSEMRSRASMASATIVFDNEDGWLPIDFSEVSITRRAYRDGQNEYLLNGQRVRLKEIAEMLGQSGLAERTYTIIGQGLVDAALSLRPDERRRFFEEAAGIGLYRRRREDALNRLDSTRRNLERVIDIISEIEPRLRSLERQARRVSEFDQIDADLRHLQREWYGYHWHRAQRELIQRQDSYRVQEEKLEKVRQNLSNLDAGISGKRSQVLELRERLSGWHSESAQLHSQREKISRQLAVLDERQRAINDQNNNFQSDLARLEEDQMNQHERQQQLQSEYKRLETEAEEARKQVLEARQALEAQQTERKSVEEELRHTRRSLVDRETRLVELKAHKNELAGRMETDHQMHQTMGQTLQTEEQKLRQAETHLEELLEQRQQAELDFKTAKEELTEHNLKITDLESTKEKQIAEQSRLDVEKSRLGAQLEVLEQAERSFSGMSQGSRFVLQTASEGKLFGDYAAINQEMVVDKNYETAVASVMGEYLDGVVLGNPKQVVDVLRLLENGEKGRTVLLPNQPMGSAAAFLAPDDPDCLGIAADNVEASTALQPLIQLLLGGIVIARDRQAASRLRDRFQNENGFDGVVTLNGEIFWRSGVVVAGKDSKVGMISRSRQKRELLSDVQLFEKKLSEAEKTRKLLEEELEAHHQTRQELDGRLKNESTRFEDGSRSYQDGVMEVEQARRKLEWHHEQVTSLSERLQAVEKDLADADKRIGEMQLEFESAQKKVRQLSRDLNGLPLNELQSEEVHWNTQAVVIESALKEMEKRIAEQQRETEFNRNQQEVLNQRLLSSRSSMEQLEVEKETSRQEEKKLSESIELLRLKIEPAEKELAQTESEYEGLQQSQGSIRQSTTAAERNAAQAQHELTRQREKIEALRTRIHEDLGLMALEYESTVSGPTPLPLEGVGELPQVQEISVDLEDNINRHRAQLRRIGAINPEAQNEYNEVKSRYEFLTTQVDDLKRADSDLRQVIAELDILITERFKKTFDATAIEFRQMFRTLFGGGSARLKMIEADNPAETGIDIEARLPGRRETGLALLSGGERSLTAVALIFSLLKVSPTPFCVLDEVDAMLDEANVGRFNDLLRELSVSTQFIVVTHNRRTVQTSDVIYGVTMGRDSSSKIISLRLDELDDTMMGNSSN
jgi:chromosome segregation protein